MHQKALDPLNRSLGNGSFSMEKWYVFSQSMIKGIMHHLENAKAGG
jgi:hypothetical protein